MANRTAPFLVLSLLALAGCNASHALVPLTDPAIGVADIRTIHVATTRQESDNRLEIYSGERAYRLNYSAIDVSIPRERAPGSIRYPGTAANPATDFAATGITRNKNRETMVASMNAALDASDGNSLSVFVHGYNTDFAESLYRHAQIVADYDFKGASLAYSWPSAGRAPLYLYDRDSAQYARAGLVDTIRMATETKSDDVVLLAHSMGTIILMEALRELALSGETDVLERINAVILAAPDIDVDVFRSQIADLQPRPQPFVVIVSSQDRALGISQRIRGGHPRLGEGTDIETLNREGIVVIDLSEIDDGGRIQHNTFASSPTMIALGRSGALEREALVAQDQTNASVGDSVEGLFDLAARIVYAPVTITNP